jgi:hypothetical protein
MCVDAAGHGFVCKLLLHDCAPTTGTPCGVAQGRLALRQAGSGLIMAGALRSFLLSYVWLNAI